MPARFLARIRVDSAGPANQAAIEPATAGFDDRKLRDMVRARMAEELTRIRRDNR